jgi:hypothetical protein
MHRIAATAVFVLALAACNKEPAKPKTTSEVVAEAGKLARPEPGMYQTHVQLIDFSIPGMPAAQAEQIRKMMGGVQRQTGSYCLTPEEAKKGFEDGIRKMTEGGNGGMKCSFKKFAVAGGRLDAAMACTGPQGMTSDIAMDGTASSEASSMHMKMDQKSSMIPGGAITMEMKMDSKRVGDCTG